MNLHNRRALKLAADDALAAARDPRRIVKVYIGISILISAAVVAVDALLAGRIENTSGLSNMGTRAIFQTVQSALPYLQLFLGLCLDMGFLSAVLRLSRRQHADERELLQGLRLFGPAFRASFFQWMVYAGLMLFSFFLGFQIFCLTPLSNAATQIVLPFVNSATTLEAGIVLDEATYAALSQAVIPALVIIAVIYAAVCIPVSYRLRMVRWCLLDNPRAGARAAIRSSWRMTRGNCLALAKLDLSFWGWYVLSLLTTALCYGDYLLPLVGIALPIPPKVSYYIFYGAYFLAHFGLNLWLRLKVDTTYAMAYEALRPKPEPEGVVLGNIFDL